MDAKIIASVFILCICGDVLSDNPDSEIVQDATKSTEAAGKKPLQSRGSESFPSLAVITDSHSTGVKILRPIFTDVGIIWREIGTSSGDEKIRIRDRGSFLDVFSTRRNNGTSSFVPMTVKRDSFDITSPPIRLPPSGTYAGNNEGRASSGTFYIPANSDNIRPMAYPGGQRNRNYGFVSYGMRSYVGRRPSNNPQNTRASFPNNSYNVPSNKDVTASPAVGNRQPPVQPVNTDPPSATNNRKVPPDSNMFAAIVNDFAFKLVESLNQDTNFVISPLSIFMALSVCYLGAEGRTKAQLEQVLGLNDFAVHDEHLHHGISDLLSMLTPESNEYQLFLASGLFLGRNFTVEQPFREDLQKFYSSELKNLDFSSPQSSLQAINEWVSKSTRNTITNFISNPPPAITRLLLMNAIFFKGIWKTQFSQEFTVNERFFSLDGTEKEVPLMNLYRETFPIFRSDEHKHSFIKLPYNGDQVSMIIALPYRHQDPPMQTMTDQLLCHTRDAMADVQLSTVALPKFRLEHFAALKGPLSKLGISDIFGGSVDLSKLRKQNDIYVTDILHKAAVDVDEVGTTASAATSVQFVPLSSFSDDFVANHPFAFYIVHEPSGLVLFYGKVFDLGEVPKAPANYRRQSIRVSPYSGREVYQASPSNRGQNNARG